MGYSRDPVIVESIKVAWTEGRSSGFIPWSFFLKDESANKKEESILFYQPFGFAGPAWRSIDEQPYPEATEADYYDMRNAFGRWEYLRYMDPESPAFKEIASLSFEEALVAARLGRIHSEEEESRFHLVPEWSSYISYDQHIALLWREREEIERAKLLRLAKERCADCAADDRLYGDGYRFFHRKNFAFVLCSAHEQHGRLETEAWAMFSKTSKENYHLLRGHIDRYSRLNSSKKLIRSHSAFRKLVDMGPEAIPFILNDLKKDRIGGIWSAEILAELTGRRGGDPAWWLSWAKSENYEVGYEA